MTNSKNFNFDETGIDDGYCKAFDVAGRVIIRALVSEGYDFITLTQLYKITGAVRPSYRNGVRWAVRHAKDNGLLMKTKTNGVYEVV
jgi:hypothetical protein